MDFWRTPQRGSAEALQQAVQEECAQVVGGRVSLRADEQVTSRRGTMPQLPPVPTVR